MVTVNHGIEVKYAAVIGKHEGKSFVYVYRSDKTFYIESMEG